MSVMIAIFALLLLTLMHVRVRALCFAAGDCTGPLAPCQSAFFCDGITCRMRIKPNNASCAAARDCTFESLCDGVNAGCPAPRHKPNGTACSNGAPTTARSECVQTASVSVYSRIAPRRAAPRSPASTRRFVRAMATFVCRRLCALATRAARVVRSLLLSRVVRQMCATAAAIACRQTAAAALLPLASFVAPLPTSAICQSSARARRFNVRQIRETRPATRAARRRPRPRTPIRMRSLRAPTRHRA